MPIDPEFFNPVFASEDVGPVPPAGIRIPATGNAARQAIDRAFRLAGEAPFKDLDGGSIWIGSVVLDDMVIPCKVANNLSGFVRYPYGGNEVSTHQGRFDILPITGNMEWVLTAKGQVPSGRVPVEGGYEANGSSLYHAMVRMPESGLCVPGKTGQHLNGGCFPYGGREYNQSDGYYILCWAKNS